MKIDTLTSYLTFRLGEETFAANVAKVLSILEMTKITKVPKAPSFMRGVINLRGAVLPIVDTRVKFGMEPTEVTPNTCILVLEVDGDGEPIQVGALVDAVQEVIEIEAEELLPPPSLGISYQAGFISGMFKHSNDTFMMILNMDLVFSTDEIIDIRQNTTDENLS